MRRSPLVLSAVLCLLALLGSSGPGLAERTDREPTTRAFDQGVRTVAMGVSIDDGRRLADLDAHTRAVGRAPATWSIWSQWGDPGTRSFPTTTAKGARERGSTPLIFWEPVDPADLASPQYARHANIIAGDHDEYIRRFARAAKDFGRPVILRLAHEANGRHFQWGMGRFDNTPASFVAAWRHVHDIFRSVGARNVRFLWSVGRPSRRPC